MSTKEKVATTKKKKKKEPKVVEQQVTQKEQVLKDQSDKLPKKIAEKKVVCKAVGEAKPVQVNLNTITATSKNIYVDDIHTANPQVLQTIYWAIMPNTRLVVAHMTEQQYEEVVKKTGQRINHLVSVVDCSVIPMLTYGSWKIDELSNGFPSPQQIKEQEARFKNNPAMFHNQPVKIELYEDDANDTTQEETEEEDILFDFEEEDTFDFGEED